MSCQNSTNFNFKLLNPNNNKLTDSTKIYLKHYFGDIDYKKSKEGLYLNSCPENDTSYSAKLEEALNPKPLLKHIKSKIISYNNSYKEFEVIDTSYFEKIPVKSLITSSKDYYIKQESLAKMQIQNSSNIDEVVFLSYNSNDLIKIKGNYLELNFGVNNMCNKTIKEIYGLIGLKDNYGNIIMKAEYSFKGKVYNPLSLYDFESVLSQNDWYNITRIGKNIDDETINNINRLGKDNFILAFRPTRINFIDGTYLLSEE